MEWEDRSSIRSCHMHDRGGVETGSSASRLPGFALQLQLSFYGNLFVSVMGG